MVKAQEGVQCTSTTNVVLVTSVGSKTQSTTVGTVANAIVRTTPMPTLQSAAERNDTIASTQIQRARQCVFSTLGGRMVTAICRTTRKSAVSRSSTIPSVLFWMFGIEALSASVWHTRWVRAIRFSVLHHQWILCTDWYWLGLLTNSWLSLSLGYANTSCCGFTSRSRSRFRKKTLAGR